MPDRGEHPALFGPPPLFDGEDTKIYEHLLTEISIAVTPADIFEKMWVRDIVDLTIEVFRLRRLEANLMKVNVYKGLSETLMPLVGRSEAEALAEGWAARKPEVVERVNKTLKAAGLSTDSILAQTLSYKLNDIERIKHMTALAETRRNVTLREIDRHRQTLSEKLRWAAQQLEDGQFRVIESTPPVDGDKCEVTSRAKKCRSNRANARSSSGPKTAKGRARSARNALRYGLSLPVLSDPTLSEEVADLARQIAGADATPEIQELALPYCRSPGRFTPRTRSAS